MMRKGQTVTWASVEFSLINYSTSMVTPKDGHHYEMQICIIICRLRRDILCLLH